MLKRLEISNVALIDKLSIDFDSGLNILTGETGAGKSIIIDSINTLIGDRTNRELIRSGADSAYVEGLFEISADGFPQSLKDAGIEPEPDGTLLLSREIQMNGRNVCRVNGRMTTVSILKETGEFLIDVHGQYDSQSLLRTSSHIELLDEFGGKTIKDARSRFSTALDRFRQIKSSLDRIYRDNRDREKRIDVLKFQIAEIDAAALKSNEEEDLLKQKAILSNSEKINTALSASLEKLVSENIEETSALDKINVAISEIKAISRFSDEYANILSQMEDILYKLEDVIVTVRNERDAIDITPGLLDNVEDRLHVIEKIKRKYGETVEAVVNYCEECRIELESLLNSEKQASDLEMQLKTVKKELFECGKALGFERKAAADILEKSIGKELDDLDMKGSKFMVQNSIRCNSAEELDDNVTENGLDQIEFIISTNPGEPLKPLSKIASGGEMSRIMLAIKKILADADKIPTLIFDEIDMGIGGRTAAKIGEKLNFIADKHQVICVTHLAQIAAIADSHFKISKLESQNRTITSVRKLDKDERISEIARIMGGQVETEISLSHAREIVAAMVGLKQSKKKSS